MTNHLLISSGLSDVDQVCVWRDREAPELFKEKLSTKLDSKPFLQPGFPEINHNHSRRHWNKLKASQKGTSHQEWDQLYRKREQKRRESGNGPQSLSLPPTRQDMPKARGMPHICFPLFPFLITTDTHCKHRLLPNFNSGAHSTPLLPRLSCQSCNVILLCDIPLCNPLLLLLSEALCLWPGATLIIYKLLQLFEGVSVHAIYILGNKSLSNNEFNMCDWVVDRNGKRCVTSSAGTNLSTFIDR